MSNYEQKLNKAFDYLKSPSMLTPTGDKPIVNFVYDPKDATEVRQMEQGFIKNKAEYLGFKPVFVSFGKVLNDYISNNTGMVALWQTVRASQENRLYQSIQQDVEDKQVLEAEFLRIQEEHLNEPMTLIVITGLEMMQPIYLMNKFEAHVYNKIKLPVLVLYPGEFNGMAKSFLSIYNPDPNYRSINF